MTNVGGSIEAISLKGREFEVTPDADTNIEIGGFENEVLSNGGGGARLIKTRKPLEIDGIALDTDESRGDAEFLQNLANLKDFFPIALTNASGTTWQGSAQITGPIKRGTQSGSTPISLKGPGILTRQ